MVAEFPKAPARETGRGFFAFIGMISIAITGGIGCGKSMAAARLIERWPAGRVANFCSDEAVAELLATPAVQEAIAEIAGDSRFIGDKGLDKAALRKEVFENCRFREKVQELLHPLVLEKAKRFAQDAPEDAVLALYEVPLLYEVDFPLARAIDLVVAASRSSQLDRLCGIRGIPKAQAEKMLEAQWPVLKKVDRGQVVVWNDGDIDSLYAQVDHLADRCQPLFELE